MRFIFRHPQRRDRGSTSRTERVFLSDCARKSKQMRSTRSTECSAENGERLRDVRSSKPAWNERIVPESERLLQA